jgi:2'-5' RNA ligase
LGGVRNAPVPVQVGELGCFDRTGILFAGVVVTRELAAVQQRVVKATIACGFVPETRPFHPHVTLARKVGNKGPREQGNKLRELIARAQRQAEFTRFLAADFVLYESHLGATGARYEVRRRFPLTGV